MELITTTIMKKSDEGVHGNIFGGVLLSLIDDAAASYVSQICDTQRVVTLKIDELVFKKPVKVGSILKIYGGVVQFGNTSVTISIDVRKHNVYTGAQETVTHTKMVFVRIDDDGNPRPFHSHIKTRYWDRFAKFGKGLLDQKERMSEETDKLSDN